MNIKRHAIAAAIGMSTVTATLQVLMMTIATLQNTFCGMHGYSATQFSVVISVYSGGAIIAGLFLNQLIQKFGIKKLAILSAFAPVITLVGLRFVGSIFLSCIVTFIGGLLVGLTASAVMGMYIGSWFNSGKGTMMSVAQTICAAAAVVLVPIATKIMVAADAETAPLIIGILFTVLAMIGSLFVKGMPADYGVQPVDLSEKKGRSSNTNVQEVYDVQMPAKKLITKLPVIAALLMSFLSILCLSMFGTYGVYIFEAFVGNLETASYYVSAGSALGIAFAFLFGVLCDKIGITKSVVVFGVLYGASRIFGVILGGTPGAIVMTVFNGAQVFATMYIGVAFPLIVGYRNIAAVAGWASGLMSAGGMVAPVVAMNMVAASKSYNTVIITCGILMLISTVLGVYSISGKASSIIKKADQKWLSKNELS